MTHLATPRRGPRAAKAGFVNTIKLLLDHGADPDFRDDNGLTPPDWLARALKSVDRDAVRRLLRRQVAVRKHRA
jgi:ankyrin repeat protein